MVAVQGREEELLLPSGFLWLVHMFVTVQRCHSFICVFISLLIARPWGTRFRLHPGIVFELFSSRCRSNIPDSLCRVSHSQGTGLLLCCSPKDKRLAELMKPHTSRVITDG